MHSAINWQNWDFSANEAPWSRIDVTSEPHSLYLIGDCGTNYSVAFGSNRDCFHLTPLAAFVFPKLHLLRAWEGDSSTCSLLLASCA